VALLKTFAKLLAGLIVLLVILAAAWGPLIALFIWNVKTAMAIFLIIYGISATVQFLRVALDD